MKALHCSNNVQENDSEDALSSAEVHKKSTKLQNTSNISFPQAPTTDNKIPPPPPPMSSIIISSPGLNANAKVHMKKII